MKKSSKIVALTVAVAASLAGLGAVSGQAQSGTVTLNWWHWWGSAQRKPTVDKIVDTWNRAHPNIQVRTTFIPYDQYFPKVLASVAAGDPPDIALNDIRTTKFRGAKNQILDLNTLGAASIKDKFFPNLWATGTVGSKQYSIPFNTDTRLLFYNKAAFKEAGITSPPRSWAELEQDAAKLDKKQGDTYTRVGFNPMYGDFGFEGWVNNAGALMWDKDYVHPNFTSPTAISTLQWIKKWVDRMGVRNYQVFKSSFGSQGQNEFLSGKVAMEMRNINFLTDISKYAPEGFDYGIAFVPTPSGKQGPMSSWGGGFNIEIPNGTKHPKEAFEFVKYLSTQAEDYWTQEQNDFPGNRAAVAFAKDPLFLKGASNMKYTIVSQAPVYAQNYGSIISKATDDVLLRGADPKTALEQAQAAAEKMVQENMK